MSLMIGCIRFFRRNDFGWDAMNNVMAVCKLLEGLLCQVTKQRKLYIKGKKPSFVDYLIDAPSLHEPDLKRDKSPMRDVDL